MTLIDSFASARVRHRDAVYRQSRVITTLISRELRTRFGYKNLGLIWILAEPMCFTFFLVWLRSFMSKVPPIGTSLEVFFFTGLMPYIAYRNLAGKLTRAIDGNRALLQLPPVTNINCIIARAALEVIIITSAVVIWLAAFSLMGLQYLPDEPLNFMAGFGAIALLGFGAGTFNAVVCALVPWWAHVVPWIQTMMFFSSGAIFQVTNFPHYILQYLWWNPLFHAVEWIRSSFYGGYESAHLSTQYILLVGGGFLYLGLLLERTFRRQISTR